MTSTATSSETKKRFIIIGGGIAGPAVALFLQRAGHSVEIYERTSSSVWNVGSLINIAPNGVGILQELGIAEKVAVRGTLTKYFYLREYKTGALLASASNGDKETYAADSYSVRRNELFEVLSDELKSAQIPVHFNKKMVRYEYETGDDNQKSIKAYFQDGTTSEFADALIGCDGLHSGTRKLMLGDKCPSPTYSGLIGLGGFVAAESLPEETLALIKNDEGMSFVQGVGGFFGMQYLRTRDNKHEIGWFSNLPQARELEREEYAQQGEAELQEELLKIHGSWAEPIPSLIKNANTGTVLKLPIYDIKDLPSWTKERVVLVGDAAHAIQPHAGQGTSLALEDALVLVNCIRANPQSLENAFAVYETVRRPRAEKIVKMARQRGGHKAMTSPMTVWMVTRLMALLFKILPTTMNKFMWNFEEHWRSEEELNEYRKSK